MMMSQPDCQTNRLALSAIKQSDDTPPAGDGQDAEGSADVATKTRAKVKKPSLYRVLLLNDDYTPMDFVIDIIQRIFHKNQEDATEIMLRVHHTGMGECGVYTYEVAEAKATEVMKYARRHEHPLQCVIEKE